VSIPQKFERAGFAVIEAVVSDEECENVIAMQRTRQASRIFEKHNMRATSPCG